MSAKVVEICQGIVDFLNSESFSQTFTATRKNVWLHAMEDTDDLQVVVVPQEAETEPETRAGIRRTYRVHIVVQQPALLQDDQDALIELSEEIEAKLYGVPMAGAGMVTFGETTGPRVVIETNPIGEQRLFRTVIQISYLSA
jgi:hypothetical protein